MLRSGFPRKLWRGGMSSSASKGNVHDSLPRSRYDVSFNRRERSKWGTIRPAFRPLNSKPLDLGGGGQDGAIHRLPFSPDPQTLNLRALVEAVKMGHFISVSPEVMSLLGDRADRSSVCPSPVNGKCQQYDVRHMVRPSEQRAATAPMGSVVDHNLRVMGGVRGLRVVDTAAALSSCGGESPYSAHSEPLCPGRARLTGEKPAIVCGREAFCACF